MKNGLYIVSTPIGNLNDISARAIDTLKKSDLIICENPKHSLKLLLKLDIKKKLISLHDYNEDIVIKRVAGELKNKICSLISDAGSPLISDPGYKLARFCFENKIYVTVIPGPSSLTSALQLSTIPINEYVFYGFLPKSKNKIIDFVNILRETKLTSVFFVSRHKIQTLLSVMSEELNDRKLAVCKEITKINEGVFVGFPKIILDSFERNNKKFLGEFVVVVEGDPKLNEKKEITSETEVVLKKLLNKFSLTDTVEIVHKIGKIGKKEIYRKTLELKNEK